MPLKKSELYASLWKSCDELRGGMDASQYKDYVLVLLFMKYVSDKAASRPDYDLIVPPGGSFADMVALKNKADIGEGINKVIATLAEANENLRGAIDVADFNDPDKLGKGKDKVDRLTNLVGIFENPSLDFRGNSAEGDDLLGDAYEYLMRNFATESGKSKGQFYTPAEVSRIMAAVVGVTKATSGTQSIYDPTCGSGSLLLKAHDAAKNATGFDLAIYGQEMDNATAALARMNMVLHDATTAEIWQDNTLASPYFRDATGGLKTFDYVVANPPFSTKSWMNGFDPAHDDFGRFRYGMPPPKNGDYAFLLHMLASLKSTGRAAVILPHGVLFRGNQEAVIRRELIRQGFLEGVIGLPANLFYGTGIPACILVIDKRGAQSREGVYLVDASRGFVKDGAKNRLRAQDIHRIVDTYVRRLDVPRYSRFVPFDEIDRNSYNLNLTRYVDSSDPEDLHDLWGHVLGGIPNRDIESLGRYWDALPNVREMLFAPSRSGYSGLRVEPTGVRNAIAAHPDLADFEARVAETFDRWCSESRQAMERLTIGSRPKGLLDLTADSILAAFSAVPLVDAYAIYQHVVDAWDARIQDDAYLVANVGWLEAGRPRLIVDGAGRTKEAPDFTVGRQRFKSDLLPRASLVSMFFAPEQAALDDLEAREAMLAQEIDALVEENSVDGGAFEDLLDPRGKISTRAVHARLREILASDEDEGAERAALEQFTALSGEVAAMRSDLKSMAGDLERRLAQRYAALDAAEIRAYTVEQWVGLLRRSVLGEVQRISSALTERVEELAERYGTPLPDLEVRAAAAGKRVREHLQRMGIG